jgi:hypothetical protein
MAEYNFNFQGQWVAGIEIESSEGKILNWMLRKGVRKKGKIDLIS